MKTTWGEIKLGSNTVANSTGVIEIEGQEIIGMELGNDGKLLLDVDVYGPGGQHLAKLRKNSWVFGDRDAFEIARTSQQVRMVEKASGRVVLDARLAQLGTPTIDVAAADLYGPSGSHVEVRPDGSLVVAGAMFSDCVFDGAGKAIVVGSTGVTAKP